MIQFCTMKFYDRKYELDKLKEIYDLSAEFSHMVVITGRRRIGKTELIVKFAQEKDDIVYLFVSKKKPVVLLQEYRDILSLKIPFLKNTAFITFEDFFNFLFSYMKENRLIIIFDEFQNFESVEPSVFSVLQNYWDSKKNDIKGAFIFIGSVFSSMQRIFAGENEPLAGRTTAKLYIEPLKPSALVEMLEDYNVKTPSNLLFYYSLFGGVPKYYFLLDRYKLFPKSKAEVIKKLFCERNAPLQNEGREIFIEEFGKNYGVYFSILQSIASGNTQMVRIADYCGININSIGKYLEELTSLYKIIERKLPVTEYKVEAKIGRYRIIDNAVSFWFRYIYKNQSLIEIGEEKILLDKIYADLNTFMGFKFEELIKSILIEKNSDVGNNPLPFQFTKIGGFWTKKENIEIDIVAYNEEEKKIIFGECKLNGNGFNSIDVKKFKEKASFVEWERNIRAEYFALFSLVDVKEEIKRKLEKEKIKVYSLRNLL